MPEQHCEFPRRINRNFFSASNKSLNPAEWASGEVAASQPSWEQLLTQPLPIYYRCIILYLIAPSSNSNLQSLPLGAFKYFCGVLLFIGVFLSSLLHYLFIIWACAQSMAGANKAIFTSVINNNY